MIWYEALPTDKSWNSLWSGYVACSCRGIRRLDAHCSACGEPPHSAKQSTYFEFTDANGVKHSIASATYMGVEGRYEDWVYLQMLEREWLRPITDEDRFLKISERSRPSARAIVVLVFWTYFETKIERLLRVSLSKLPSSVMEDLLQRYSSVGSRMDRLYRIAFSTSYNSDLIDTGYSNTASLLQRVQASRNKFMHGHPEAIDDTLVEDLISGLKEEHESWIAVFNRRIAEALASNPRV